MILNIVQPLGSLSPVFLAQSDWFWDLKKINILVITSRTTGSCASLTHSSSKSGKLLESGTRRCSLSRCIGTAHVECLWLFKLVTYCQRCDTGFCWYWSHWITTKVCVEICSLHEMPSLQTLKTRINVEKVLVECTSMSISLGRIRSLSRSWSKTTTVSSSSHTHLRIV